MATEPTTEPTGADQEVIDRITMWRDRGVNPGGIASALRAEGLGQWTTSAVRAALKRLDAQAGLARTAEAMFTPGDEDEDAEGWEGHCGDKFVRPWLDSTGCDLRDKCVGEQGSGGSEGQPDTTFADRAVEHAERAEEAEKGPGGNPWGSTVTS